MREEMLATAHLKPPPGQLPHIWDSLWLSIPPSARAVIATISVPYLIFSFGNAISSGASTSILTRVWDLIRLGQQAGYSVMGGPQGRAAGEGLGGFVSGAVTAGAVIWGWNWVKRFVDEKPTKSNGDAVADKERSDPE